MTIMVYGFDRYNKVTGYSFIKTDSRQDWRIASAVARELNYEGTVRAYAIPNRPGLKESYFEARKSRDIADHYQFRDEVEREAIYGLAR